MENDNIIYAPVEHKWVELSYNRYTESFVFPNKDVEFYDDIEFLFQCKNESDNDFMFDLLCEEMDEIFS